MNENSEYSVTNLAADEIATFVGNSIAQNSSFPRLVSAYAIAAISAIAFSIPIDNISRCQMRARHRDRELLCRGGQREPTEELRNLARHPLPDEHAKSAIESKYIGAKRRCAIDFYV